MSKERELLKKILNTGWLNHELSCEVEAILAQPEQQAEAWIVVNKETGYRTQVSHFSDSYDKNTFGVIPLYTAPLKREPLSDDVIADLWGDKYAGKTFMVRNFARAIEKAHGITGGGE